MLINEVITGWSALLQLAGRGQPHFVPLLVAAGAFKGSTVDKNICDLVSWPWKLLVGSSLKLIVSIYCIIVNTEANPKLKLSLQRNQIYSSVLGEKVNYYVAFDGLRDFNKIVSIQCYCNG